MWGRARVPIATKSLKPRYVIGIDGALRNNGVVVLDNLGNLIAHTCIVTKQGTPDAKSIDIIIEQFFEFVDPYLVRDPSGAARTVIYSEEILFGKDGKSTGRAKARGVLEWNLRQERFPVFAVTPKAVNSFIANKYNVKFPGGRGDGLTSHQRTKRIKQLTMETLHHSCNFYTKNEHVADAYAIALFGIGHAVEKQPLAASALYSIL